MYETYPTPGDTRWFVQDRFGLFIHWGLYALPARHEWIKQQEQIPDEKYDMYFKRFEPDLYDPTLWAKTAASAGMKYFVITTKHHDGFCLWDSQFTDYKATNTLAKRDLLRPMIEAFRKENMRVGLYHSLIDWHHPEFVIDDMHAFRNVKDRAEQNAKRDQKKYIAYLHNQVRELLSNYGQIDVLWFDFSYRAGTGGRPADFIGKGHKDWDSENLLKLVRSLQPKVILDDRLDWPEGWDIKTPEQFQPRGWIRHKGQRVVWEACQTFSGSWGYHRDEESWKSIDQLIVMLVDTVSKGGNLLLNVGPTGRGEIDACAMDRLNGIGEWMKRHSRSIYGCTQAPEEFVVPHDCRYTYNPDTKRLYLHLLAWPFGQVHLPNMADKVEYAQLLNDASELKMEGLVAWQAEADVEREANLLTIHLPVKIPNVTVPVIELFLK